MYLDELIFILRSSGCGCHIVEVFVAAILYADDLALTAPTRSSLQHLIDLCVEYSKKWCVTYNFWKTKVLVFGKERNMFFLGDQTVEVVPEWKYLGVTVIADLNFAHSTKADFKSFMLLVIQF